MLATPYDAQYLGKRVEIKNDTGARWIRVGEILTVSSIKVHDSFISLCFKEKRKRNWRCSGSWLIHHFIKEYHDAIAIEDILSKLDILEAKLKGESSNG